MLLLTTSLESSHDQIASEVLHVKPIGDFQGLEQGSHSERAHFEPIHLDSASFFIPVRRDPL